MPKPPRVRQSYATQIDRYRSGVEVLAAELNDRPRRTLGWLNHPEQFTKLAALAQPQARDSVP